MSDRSLTETFGAFIADPPPVPQAAIERVQVSLVHNLVMAMSGRRRETVAHRAAAAHPGPATLLASGARAAPDWAALANGALFHARSQDDVHLDSTSHPGAPVTAAALAVAEAEGASGRAFLEALALGYEVLCRIGRDFDQELSARGFRAAAVWGGFGAAAAAARLQRLGPAASGHALGLATHQAGGLLQVWREGSAEYPYHLGFAARNGVVAAELAGAGATAGRWMLEGEAGVYAAFAGERRPPVEALEGLGTAWQVEEVTVKGFPACAVLQGPMEAILRLRALAGGAEVAGGTIRLSPFEATFPGIDNPGPGFASPTATKMSAQFCLAVGLLDGRLMLDDLSRLGDPEIGRLAGRIAVEADAGLADRQCRIELRLVDGRRLADQVDGPVGRPDFAGITAFALRLASEIGAGEAALERLVDEVRRLDGAPGVEGLLDALAAVRGSAGPAGARRGSAMLRIDKPTERG